MSVPEGYTAFEYYFIVIAMSAVLLFAKAFIFYIYYGLPLTLAYTVFRVFRKRNEPIKWK